MVMSRKIDNSKGVIVIDDAGEQVFGRIGRTPILGRYHHVPRKSKDIDIPDTHKIYRDQAI
jgi:hypothetical protein